MRNFGLIVLALFLLSQTTPAQTGYKEIDSLKYDKSELITDHDGFKTFVYYKDNSIRKIIREFTNGKFSDITIYYIKDGQLIRNVYASLRVPQKYFEEHMYFNTNGKMYKWINTRDKEVNPFETAFEDKEKLVLKFFNDDLKEAKNKKAVR
jgi:hypothetical protein